MLWHVVLISFRPDAPENLKEWVWNRYQTLDKDCGGKEAGILLWAVRHNHDLRKNVHLVELSIFRDNEALQAFRAHQKHTELVKITQEISDWQVGDIEFALEDANSLLPLSILKAVTDALNINLLSGKK